MKEEEDCTVVINDSTKEAFEDFLGFNYEKNIDFEKKTLRELYDILNLAERYRVERLEEEVRMVMTFPIKFEPIAHENVIEDPLKMENTPDGRIKIELLADDKIPLQIGDGLSKLCSEHDNTKYLYLYCLNLRITNVILVDCLDT